MSKNNKSTVSIAEQIAALEAQKAKLVELEQAEKQERMRVLGEKIDKLPAMFEVQTLAEVRNLINQREKGTLGALASDVTPRQRVVLSDAEKAELVKRFDAGGPDNQRSKLVAHFGISAGTLQNILKAHGRVNSRAATPAATPAATA